MFFLAFFIFQGMNRIEILSCPLNVDKAVEFVTSPTSGAISMFIGKKLTIGKPPSNIITTTRKHVNLYQIWHTFNLYLGDVSGHYISFLKAHSVEYMSLM